MRWVRAVLVVSVVSVGGCAQGTADLAGGDDADAAVSVADSGRPSLLCAPPAAVGCPCADAAHCESGVCLTGSPSGVCTAPCDQGCPDGWACGDDGVCLPPTGSLCRLCADDEDCGPALGSVCVTSDDLWFCGSVCESVADCPGGYRCEQVREDPALRQCVPLGGQCPCSASAAGAESPCLATTAHGMCPGRRRCEDGGLTACEPSPTEEVCNGQDDDCDGQIDSNRQPCTRVAPAGTCSGERTCVNGAWGPCDAPDPAPEVCNGQDDDCDGTTDEGTKDLDGDSVADCVDPDRDGDGAPDAEDCAPADGRVVCHEFHVDGDGDGHAGPCAATVCACAPPAGATDGPCDEDCDDGDPEIHAGAPERCNGEDDDCDGQTDEGLPVGAPCDGPDPDLCQNGETVCAPDGGTACAETVEVPESCNGLDDDCDGEADEGCAAYFKCNALSCGPAGCVTVPKSCDDGNPCTDDGCSGGCTHAPVPGVCDDGDLCTTGDTCEEGVCLGAPMACDDGLPCTSDACVSGECVHSADGVCVVGGICVPAGSLSPDDPCAVCDPALSTTGYTALAAGSPCDDGSPCTTGEACGPAGCVPAAILPAGEPCDDSDPCTSVTHCAADGACTGPVDLDADGDGYVAASCPSGSDCDDGSPLVHPGAPDPFDLETESEDVAHWGDRGEGLTVVTGPEGDVHAVWRNRTTWTVEHGRSTGERARLTELFEASGESFSAGAAVDAEGRVHVAFQEGAEVRVATLEDDAWTVQTPVPASVGGGEGVRLVSDGAALHLVHRSGSAVYLLSATDGAFGDGEIVYQKPSGATWAFAGSTELLVAPDGTLHVLFVKAAAGAWELLHARREGAVWQTGTITTKTLPDAWAAAFGPDGTLHVLYGDAGGKLGVLTRLGPKGWESKTLIDNGTSAAAKFYGPRWGLVVRDDGGIDACTMRSAALGKKAVIASTSTALAGGWASAFDEVELETTGAATGWCSVVRGTDGRLHVTWSVGFEVERVTREPGAAYGAPTKVAVFNGLGAGVVSTAVAGLHHAAALDYDPASLHHVHRLGGRWVHDTLRLDGGLTEGSVAVSADGTIHGAWRATDGALRYGVWQGDAFESVTVGQDVMSQSHPALVLGPSGKAYIAWMTAAPYDLRLSIGGLGGFTTYEVDQQGSAGFEPSLVLDGQGKVHIAYRMSTWARYITNKDGGFGQYEVPTAASIGEDRLLLGVDSKQKAMVAFKNLQLSTMMYATNRSGAWVETPVVTGGIVDWPMALGFDAGDAYWLAFPHWDAGYTNGRLLLATDAPGAPVIFTLDALLGATSGTLQVGPGPDLTLFGPIGKAHAFRLTAIRRINPIDENCDGL